MKSRFLSLTAALATSLLAQETELTLSRLDPSTLELRVATATNAATTEIKQSQDLKTWSPYATITGAGITQTFQVPIVSPQLFFRAITTSASYPPVLVANSQATSVGSTATLGPAQLKAVDSDTAPSSLVFTISGVTGGHFERVGTPAVQITSFTQADINNHLIRFVQDGSTTRPAYTVALSDGVNQTTPSPASISFCDGTRTATMSAGESQAFNNLVQLSQVTHTVVASGSWSDSSTWQGGLLPTAGARVHIPANLAVVVDSQLAPEFKTIRIDGMLRFAPNVNTRLKVDTIVSTHCARLEIGTPSLPVADQVTAELIISDDGPIDLTADFAQLGRGAVLHGKTVMHGQIKTPWTTLAVQPIAGATSVTLSAPPIGWKVGDQIVIAGTDPNDHASDEARTISTISGATVTLDSALARDHVAPAAGLDVHIANTTRNIRITSENTAVKRRGHVMIMHTLEADLRYVEFTGLGRTNKRESLDDTGFPDLVTDGSFVTGERNNIRGRYTLHFHRGGSDPGFTAAHVEGCSAVDSPGWAYVNHSARVNFINNVSYDILGGAYQTEAGDETGSFVNNIAIRTVNPDDPMRNLGQEDTLVDAREGVQDFAWQGDGFWIHGGGVAVDGNIVSGASGHAYIYWPEGLIEAHLGMMRADQSRVPNNHLLTGVTPFNIWWIPIASSKDNTAYSASKGLVTYYLHSTFLDGDTVPQAYRDTLNSTFERFTIWNMRYVAMDFNFTENITVKDSRIVGTNAANQTGLDANHFHLLEDLTFENITIENFDIGFDVPSNGRVTIRNCTMDNTVDLRIREPQMSNLADVGDPAPGQFGRRMLIDNIAFNNPNSTRIQMIADFNLLAEVETGVVHSTSKHPLYFMLTDEITLSFDEFQNTRLYFDQQSPGSVPITDANAILPGSEVSIPVQYRNKTNQQLHDQYGSSFGGSLLPSDAATATRITGGKLRDY